MAKRAPKQWVYSRSKPTPPKIPAALKAQVSEQADENEHFTISFMRHNGEWVELYHEQTLDESLDAIRSDEWFHP